MERKVPFHEGEIYHIYSRGVEKRIIFSDEKDWDRFLSLLLLCNSCDSVKIGNLFSRKRGEPSLYRNVFDAGQQNQEKLTEIIAYTLMPNHFHFLLREKKASGISRFMQKILTAYSMYFNTKYERSGPLFTRPFRSKHIDTDAYFRWIFAYINLNSLDISQPGWKERGPNIKSASDFLKTYRYSSFADYFSVRRSQSSILQMGNLPFETGLAHGVDELLDDLKKEGDGSYGSFFFDSSTHSSDK